MRKVFNYIILLPLAIVLILLSVANRQTTQFNLDPLDPANPAVSVELPLFVFLFMAVILGMLLGGFLMWLSQGKHRKALREKSHEAEKLVQEQAKNTVTNPSEVVEIAPGLPVATRR